MKRCRLILFTSAVLPFSVLPAYAASALQIVGLPKPPQQDSPWTPPAGDLPKLLVDDTATLFSQGFADPRGCDYRVIKIKTGSVWSRTADVVETHGWVLPDTPASSSHYAVCWNGLVYETVSIGDEASVTSDVESIIRGNAVVGPRRTLSSPASFTPFVELAFPEETNVLYTTMFPVKACLILRAGYPDLAARYWKAGVAGMSNADHTDPKATKPYSMLSKHWTWSLYDRAVCSHLNGDDALSAASARMLISVLPGVKVELAKQSAVSKNLMWDAGRLLEPSKELLADEERRLQEPARIHPSDAYVGEPAIKPVAVKDKRSPEEKARRAKELVIDLEDVSATQWGQPGAVDFSNDPIVEELAGLGDSAVEPLLDCIANDQRLTRSVGFGRAFFRERDLYPARDAAYVALMKILQTEFEGIPYGGGIEQRREFAEHIRTYWLKYHGLTGPALWRSQLLDDSTPISQQQIAAAHIVQPQNVEYYGGGGQVFPITWNDLSNPTPYAPMRGESLRKGKHPSISEILVKRAEVGIASGDANFALALAAWDAKKHLPELRRFTLALQKCPMEKLNSSRHNCLPAIVSLYFTRLRVHDPSAAGDYGAWLKSLTPRICWDDTTVPFQPAFASDAPEIRQSIREMFTDPKSPWLQYRNMGQGVDPDESYDIDNLVKSPLISQPGFLDFLLRNLSMTDATGSVEVSNQRTLLFHSDWSWQVSIDQTKVDPFLPEPGKGVTYRVCDKIANAISQIDGAPKCELYWPLQQRDAAVEQCKAFLPRYSERMRLNPKLPAEGIKTAGKI